MEGTARTSVVAALLAGFLICLAFVAGCAGNEEAREDTTEDQATEQDTQQTGEESTQESAETRAESSGGKARSEEATLEITGDEGTGFSGSCTVGDETSEIDGQAPESFTYNLNGERLDCEINTDGSLQVVLSAGKNTRSVQQISGGTLSLIYDNGQISSFSNSSGSGGSSSSSQVVSSSQNSSTSSIQINP